MISQITDNPFRNHQLIGSQVGTYRQEFNFILLIDFTVKREVTYLGMPVFDLSARLCNMQHTVGTEIIELGIRSRFMIATLIRSREQPTIF